MARVFFGPYGSLGKDEHAAREQWLARCRMRITAIDAVCSLSDRQREKLDAAARLDVDRIFEHIEAVRSRYAGRMMAFPVTAESRPEWQQIQKEILEAQAPLLGTADAESLLKRTISTVLDDNQRSRWQMESEARDRALWRAIVEDGLVAFDVQLGLTGAQHDALRDLLADNPLQIHADAYPNGTDSYTVCGYALSRVDQERLEAAVSERQWKALAPTIEQCTRWVGHLKQTKVIPE